MNNEAKCCFCGTEIDNPKKSLKLFRKPLCVHCEYQLTHLTVDHEHYEYYKDKIKQIWFPV